MAELKKKNRGEIHVQPRGWGCEVWIENAPEYCGKILFVNRGKRGSMHFHVKKLETMYLLSGSVELKLIDTDDGREYSVVLKPRESIQIPRGQPHQIVGLEDSEIVEVSTTHEESDSRRIRKGD